jgi:luciferase family oxidoreductase group 1
MKFGMFYEIQVPKPWHADTEFEIYQQVLDQAQLADEIGYDSFWAVEHHFFSEFSHCSAPEVLFGAVSQRTKKLRIGHGVVLLPFPYNHPVRVAERVAVLDLLSDGRIEVGTGRSTTEIELGGFGIPPEETRARWDEALRMLPEIWTQETFSWEGKYFNIPPRPVVPKPRQKPHPPLWMATTSEEGHTMAGQKGLGLLSFTLLVEPPELAKRIAAYRAAIKQAEPVGAFVNHQTAVFAMGYCGESPEEARETAAEAMVWATRRAIGNVLPLAQKAAGDYSYLQQIFGIDIDAITFDYLNDRSLVVVGDPEECLRTLKLHKEAGADSILLMQQVHNIPHEKVMGSIERFAKHVMPHLQ